MRHFPRFLRFYFLPMLSGVLMGLSFIPFYPLALFFCYIPLWLFALKQPSFKALFIGGWISQFVGTLIGFHWLSFTIKEFEILPWPLSHLGLLAFASIANLHIPIALLLWRGSEKALISIRAFVWERPKKSLPPFFKTLSLLFLPLYSALSMEYYYVIFKWHFGYSWIYAGWPAFQTAEIWGFQFLNSLTLFFNFLFFISFKNFLSQFSPSNSFKKTLLFKGISIPVPSRIPIPLPAQTLKKRAIFTPLSMGLSLFFSLNIYGLYLKHRWPDPDKKASLLMVQPHIENDHQKEDKWNDFISSQLLQETSQALWPDPDISPQKKELDFSENKKSAERPTLLKSLAIENLDFILWPEGGWPYPINKEHALRGQDPVQKWPLVFDTPLIVSAEGRKEDQQTNSIFVFDREGQLIQGPYDKMILMPFGEKAPLIRLFPRLSESLFGDITFDKGDGENKMISLKGLNLGFQICYESLFPRLTRDLLEEGVDILINVANDSWFGSKGEAFQNLYMTLARAIEIRRPLIRGTNSGLSAVISAKGDRLLLRSSLNKKGAWFVEVPYSSKRERDTVFVLWGHLTNPLALWSSLIMLIFFLIFSPSKSPKG